MEPRQPPLSYEASSSISPIRTTTLPSEVVACLKNTRFLHLATCDELFPHVSLMNYTYLPSSPFAHYPTIIMTTNPSSKKTENIRKNPRVSLLVHDWVSHRPPTTATPGSTGPEATRTASPPAAQSSLAALLLNLNTSALSSISATINGTAALVERGTREEAFYKEAHLQNNTFGEGASQGSSPGVMSQNEGDGGRSCFIEGEEVRVVVVRVQSGRIADWKGAVRDWEVVEDSANGGEAGSHLVNGIS